MVLVLVLLLLMVLVVLVVLLVQLGPLLHPLHPRDLNLALRRPGEVARPGLPTLVRVVIR